MTRRTALVTGSTSGIGLAIAKRLSLEGFSVVLHSRSSKEQGQRLATEISHASYYNADLSDLEAIPHFIRRVLRDTGRLDVLVNNAAMTRKVAHADLKAASPQLWRDMHDTNVIAPWLLITEAEQMLRQSAKDGSPGCVINISSHAGVRPKGASIPYAASKAALNHMTKLLAASFAPDIRFNAVAPGLVATPMTADWHDVRALWQERAPMQREASPDDIAQIVWSLVSSDYLTGEIIMADGGMNLR